MEMDCIRRQMTAQLAVTILTLAVCMVITQKNIIKELKGETK